MFMICMNIYHNRYILNDVLDTPLQSFKMIKNLSKGGIMTHASGGIMTHASPDDHGLAGHFLGLGQTHDIEHGGRDIREHAA